MRRSPRNVEVTFNHAGLTHYGGAFFLHEFLRVLQFRHFLARQLHWIRRHHDYSLSQMILGLVWPVVLGLDRIETASLLRAHGTFQFLTGLPSFPDPQTLRRFLLRAPTRFARELGRVNDRLLQFFLHIPPRRSRLILDLDSTVLTVFGRQQGAEVGYNPRCRGKRSYQPLLCLEANSTPLGAAQLRPGDIDPHSGTAELFRDCWSNLPAHIRELRQDFALACIPTRCFAANALYLEIIRLAYNLVTAFQRICLPDEWSPYTLQQLRYKLFLSPGQLARPQNRPVLRLNSTPKIQQLSRHVLAQIKRLRPRC